ncbi:hypothetical protein [Streptomyces sp. NPDC004324]
MAEDLVQRAHRGNSAGLNWAGPARLSTEETEGEALDDGATESARSS